MEVKITSFYSGENTSVEGVVNGSVVKISGDASSRGATAEIDGTDYWFCGGDNGNPGFVDEIENAVDKMFMECWDACDRFDVDPELNWVATVKDGEITEIKQVEDEDDED